MKQIYFLAASCVLIATIASTGCRNCNRTCPNGYAYSNTIAPPPTYSLNIPSANGGPAYYVPGGPNPNATASLPSYLVDPSRRAPTPAGGGSNVNQQNGWRPIGAPPQTGASTTQPQNGFTRTATAPTQVAAAPAARSVVTNVDYASTSADERRDATRLPATDASNVRAPAGFVNNGSATRLAQAQPAPSPNYPNTFNQPVAYSQPAANVYNGRAVLAQPPTAQPYYYGTPVIRQSAPTVLAQSTATGGPSGNGFSSGGWTDRELTARRNEINR